MRTLAVDIETYSSVDLKKCGAYAYVASPDFEVLLFGYAFDDAPVEVVDLACGEVLPDEVREALLDPTILKTAYNANFERNGLGAWLGCLMPPQQWRCSSVHSLMLGLPGSLELVAKTLKLDIQKDDAGKRLIKFFTMPCKATAKNGGRTRNLPEHDPEKWAQFKAYCGIDVEVERELRGKLSRHPIPDFEQALWCLDQKINDLGVRVDYKLVKQAMLCDSNYNRRLVLEAQELTGLENPNSVSQLKDWLSDALGRTVETLAKDNIPLLMDETDDPVALRMLAIRQELAKTSVKKYDAMARARGRDDRVRGLLQFYGANRTGRWAGRLVQVHNLPKNIMPDLDLARSLLRKGDEELLELLFDAIPDLLSQLIRTALIPSVDCRFIVADFSAIEARVIAWLAGEEWVLDVFRGDGRIYEAAASMMFKVPIDRIAKGFPEYELRAKGKVAVLACIAEGQLVLTNVGLIPIEDVTTQHKVWDGIQWVTHDGIIDKGIKEVISYDGLTATEDHIVWIEGESEPVRFKYAASSGAHLLRSGNGGRPIWMGENQKPRKEMEKRLERPASIDRMHKLRLGAVDALLQFKARSIKRLSSLLTTKTDSTVARQKIDSGKAEVFKSKRWELRGLRRTWDSIQFLFSIGSWALDYREHRIAVSIVGNGSHRQRWALRARQYPIRPQSSQLRESPPNGITRMESRKLALRSFSGHSETIKRGDSGSNYKWSKTGGKGQEEELAGDRRQAKCYDILNAGELDRFTVSDVLVHNCGYQGSVGALVAMGALDMGLDADELPVIVESWRAANRRIVRFWYAVERAALTAVAEKRTVSMQFGLKFIYEPGVLFIQLPSGRRLAYVRPHISRDPKFDKNGLSYEGYEEGRWTRSRTYGGKLVENIVQAVARDCLAVSMMRLDQAGFSIPVHVHDEVVLDVPKSDDAMSRIVEIMSEPLSWAPGLPLSADAFETKYYMKD